MGHVSRHVGFGELFVHRKRKPNKQLFTPTVGVKMSGWKPLVVGISRCGDGMGMAMEGLILA